MFSQLDAPLYDALIKIKKHHSFHVPGHKMGLFFDPIGRTDYLDILGLDQTEIDGLDDLHHAESVIKEAERLAAEAFGAQRTKFLVGGTTAGILSLILAVQGGVVGVQRDSHRSLFNGLKLAKGKALLIPPQIHRDFLLPIGVDTDQVMRLIESDQINTLFLTSPNYYGFTTPLEKLAERAKGKGIPLFIDEAHGAHFRFHPDFPPTALSQGATAVVQSTHKTLPAMTMASMIHWQGDLVHWEDVLEWLRTLQSSSPSYPLMASLDLARRHMVLHGERELQYALELVRDLREELSKIEWLKMIPNDDPLRLLLMPPEGWIGPLKEYLISRGIYVEMSTPTHLVFVFTPGNRGEDYEALMQALTHFPLPPTRFSFPRESPYPEEVWNQMKWISYEDLPKRKRKIPLRESIGKKAGSFVIPFPPGIPLLLEGEVIDAVTVDWIIRWLQSGNGLYGIDEGKIIIFDE